MFEQGAASLGRPLHDADSLARSSTVTNGLSCSIHRSMNTVTRKLNRDKPRRRKGERQATNVSQISRNLANLGDKIHKPVLSPHRLSATSMFPNPISLGYF